MGWGEMDHGEMYGPAASSSLTIREIGHTLTIISDEQHKRVNVLPQVTCNRARV